MKGGERMTTLNHSAVLRFVSDSNEQIRISIPRARLDIEEAEARSIMGNMITANAIVTRYGRPAEAKSMEIVTTQRDLIVKA
jgi:hypothetical protein